MNASMATGDYRIRVYMMRSAAHRDEVPTTASK